MFFVCFYSCTNSRLVYVRSSHPAFTITCEWSRRFRGCPVLMRFVRQTRLQQNCWCLCVQEWSMRNFRVVSHTVVVDEQRWFGCFKPPSLHEICLELSLKGGCLKTTKSFLIYQQYRHAIRRENFSCFTLKRTSRSGFAVNAFAAQTASKLDNFLFNVILCTNSSFLCFAIYAQLWNCGFYSKDNAMFSKHFFFTGFWYQAGGWDGL